MSRRRLLRPLALSTLLALGIGAVDGQTLFWDNPRVVAPTMGSSSSASGRGLIALAWQDVRARSRTETGSGDVFLSLAVSRAAGGWTKHPRFFGPIRYANVPVPRFYSLVVDANDRIVVAVASTDRTILILESTDDGASFRQVQRLSTKVSTGAPNLFVTSRGFLLVVSEGTSADVVSGTGSVTLAYSHSDDGSTWTDVAPFVTPTDTVASPQLQPSLASLQGREFVVFQSLTQRSDLTSTWQLSLKESADGGATWDPARPITSLSSVFGADPLAFNNERPRIASIGGQLVVVWERSTYGSTEPQIWSARLDARGALVGAPEIIAAATPARFARVLALRGLEYVLYADGSQGSFRIVLAQKGRVWETQPLQNTEVVDAVFPHAVVLDDSLYVFWENQAGAGGTSSLVQLLPLTSVGAPVVRPVDFSPGQPTNRDTVTVRWTEPQPPDPAGIKEYRYSWTYSDGSTSTPVTQRSVSGLGGAATFSATEKVDRDGTWTFSITAIDLAGNVSRAPATLSLERDATPPQAVSFQAVGTDGSVLFSASPRSPDERDSHSYSLDTNTFTLRWIPGADKDIVGYTYNLQPGWPTLGDYLQSKVSLLAPPARVVTNATEIPFRNRDNGVYVVTVRAVDRAGNFGPPSTIALALTRYQLVTRVDLVTAERDPTLGTVTLTIRGRGFTENGTLRRIYLDRAHTRSPFDIELEPRQPITVTDRLISGIVLDENRESGSYRVGLLQERPTGAVTWFTPGPVLELQSPGTVKIGNFQLLLPRWIAGRSPELIFPANSLVVVLVVALLLVFSILAARKILSLAQEAGAVQAEVIALLEGTPNRGWEERKNRMQALKRKGIGLRLKFTLLMVILVIMIVLIVAIPLGFTMVGSQRKALADDLQHQAGILMASLAASAESEFLLAGTDSFIGAVDIPKLRTAMAYANATTVTGPDKSFSPTGPKDFVWASDEDRFVKELAAKSFEPAARTVDDELARSIVPALQKKIDVEAAARFATDIDVYRTQRGLLQDLRTKKGTSPADLKAANDKLTELGKTIDDEANALYGKPETVERFDANSRLAPTYLFYKPIIYYNKAANLADTSFYQGMVRLEVHTNEITDNIDASIRGILRTAALFALLAIALGVLGAIIMASITVTPIRKLAQGVAKIRDTEDKEALKDHTILVGTRDEIGLLADTVNDMTKGLVKAAAANKELLLGKDVQKMFLPLDKDAQSRKGATAAEESARVEIYGYYEGAKGVSGDYFDFKKLDETHYAFIKCDVAGKGVPAALIMVEVATLFISYFRDWAKRKESVAKLKDAREKERVRQELERVDLLVYTINDMLEERGFKGRFAALTVCIFNSETGVATVCNAGDNIMHVYEAARRSMTQVKLPESPAAGVFPSMLVEMRSGFRQVPLRLEKGDALFLFTDGFEEAKRSLRDASGEVVACDAPEIKDGEPHLGTHTRGQTSEEFGTARMDDIVASVFARGRYRLVRHHTMDPAEELVFDFSSCTGTVKDAVLALVAVEKVFRTVPDERAGADDRVAVDANVAQFLKDHFVPYGKYFAHAMESQGGSAVTYSHLREDEQYDDLTIIVLRRK